MDIDFLQTDTLLASLVAVTMSWISWHAHALGNELRDVKLLAALTGLCWVGVIASGLV